jgi:hypothetical protein
MLGGIDAQLIAAVRAPIGACRDVAAGRYGVSHFFSFVTSLKRPGRVAGRSGRGVGPVGSNLISCHLFVPRGLSAPGCRRCRSRCWDCSGRCPSCHPLSSFRPSSRHPAYWRSPPHATCSSPSCATPRIACRPSRLIRDPWPRHTLRRSVGPMSVHYPIFEAPHRDQERVVGAKRPASRAAERLAYESRRDGAPSEYSC